MRKETTLSGMYVKVKKKAFFDGGSLSSVYDDPPRNRHAKVVGVFDDNVVVEMETDSEEWVVRFDEIKGGCRALYYKFDDGEDCFIVSSRDFREGCGAFSGEVVANIMGNVYDIGYHSFAWDPKHFVRCNFQVKGM